MKRNRDAMASMSAWVCFSDVLVTLLCALLYGRIIMEVSDPVAKAREFAKAVQAVEQKAEDLRGELKVLTDRLLEATRPLPRAPVSPPARSEGSR